MRVAASSTSFTLRPRGVPFPRCLGCPRTVSSGFSGQPGSARSAFTLASISISPARLACVMAVAVHLKEVLRWTGTRGFAPGTDVQHHR